MLTISGFGRQRQEKQFRPSQKKENLFRFFLFFLGFIFKKIVTRSNLLSYSKEMAQRSLATKPNLQNPQGTKRELISTTSPLTSTLHQAHTYAACVPRHTHSIHNNHVRYLGGVGHSFCGRITASMVTWPTDWFYYTEAFGFVLD